MRAKLRSDGKMLVLTVPMTFEQHGARKRIIAPDGANNWAPPRARVDSTLVKALARAHRWRRKLENGDYASITELAAAEKINASYVCRVLRLTLLSPPITEAILDGLQPRLGLDQLLRPFPVSWHEQQVFLRALSTI